jgi:hypothetical protein
VKRTTGLKRTGFKRKPPVRRVKLAATGRKAKKRPSVRLTKDKLWAECKRITRERYGNTCYTCGRQNLTGRDWQTGHGKAKAALPLRYKFDIRNLRPQCGTCNVYRGGMTDIFIAKLEQELEGLAFLEEACVWIDGAWYIRQDTPQLVGAEATRFVENLLAQYKRYP